MRSAYLIATCLTFGCGQGAATDRNDDDTTSGADDSSTSADVPSSSPTGSNTESSAGSSTDAQTSVDPGPPPCQPGPGTSGSPTTIIEVVDLINGLPHPVTIPCFVQALSRPLRVMAGASFISAQPAFGIDNPRLFILGDGISLTLVAEGTGKDLLEMGELTSNTHSIKAELPFPVTEPLSPEAPFTHIRSNLHNGTVCFGCHNDETEVLDYPVAGAFNSIAYRPLPELEVDLAAVKAQFIACDPSAEPERCAFYSALFEHGDVVADRFPNEMPLFQ